MARCARGKRSLPATPEGSVERAAREHFLKKLKAAEVKDTTPEEQSSVATCDASRARSPEGDHPLPEGEGEAGAVSSAAAASTDAAVKAEPPQLACSAAVLEGAVVSAKAA